MRNSICFTSYNKPNVIKRTLPALATAASEDTDIYVVDNGSDPESVQLLKEFKHTYPRLKLVLNETNLGVGAAMNQVISQIPEDHYFTKMDCDVLNETPNWDQWMMNCSLNHPNIGLLGANNFSDRPIREMVKSWDPKHDIGMVSFDAFTGDFFMMSPILRKKLGYFYEFGQYGFEDSELQVRIAILGLEFCFVMHFGSRGIDQSASGEYAVFKRQQVANNYPGYRKRIAELLKDTSNLYVGNTYNRGINAFWEPED